MEPIIADFRDSNKNKIKIRILDWLSGDDGGTYVDYIFEIHEENDKSSRCRFRFSDIYAQQIRMQHDKTRPATLLEMVKDLILGKRFNPEINLVLKLFTNRIDPLIEGIISANDETGELTYTRNVSAIIIENRIGRKLVLEHGYLIASMHANSGLIRNSKLVEACHYSQNSIDQAINYLLSAGLFEARAIHPGAYFLTDKGQARFERMFIRFGSSVFLIAACTNETKDMIEKVYSPVIEDEFHLELIFQEEEEPLKTIHEDIIDYIENCRFIVADMSGHRPNCYYELGYARAKDKQIILTINRADGKDEHGNSTLAFDTSPLRYTF